jgi:hypothetical protein
MKKPLMLHPILELRYQAGPGQVLIWNKKLKILVSLSSNELSKVDWKVLPLLRRCGAIPLLVIANEFISLKLIDFRIVI